MSFYDDHVLPRIINLVMNTKEDRKIRSRVCAGLTGEVVEIGFGTGHNLQYLPPEVKRLRAVEPSQLAVRLAHPRIAASPVAVEVVGLDGQRLPMADDTADSLLCTWSLCTIPDPVAAVAEMRRVLRPGGTLHFVEHAVGTNHHAGSCRTLPCHDVMPAATKRRSPRNACHASQLSVLRQTPERSACDQRDPHDDGAADLLRWHGRC